MPTTNKNKNKKSLTNAQKRSAKAHIISVYGSPKVRKKKESVKTRAKISASMRKKCTTKKWGSSNIWPECKNVVHDFKKSIPPLKGNVKRERKYQQDVLFQNNPLIIKEEEVQKLIS